MADRLGDAITAARAAITGLDPEDIRDEAGLPGTEGAAGAADTTSIERLVALLQTRLGLAPAVDREGEQELRALLDSAKEHHSQISQGEVETWVRLLRSAPESIPTLDREPVRLPRLPAHLERLWVTLLELEQLGEPWVLVSADR